MGRLRAATVLAIPVLLSGPAGAAERVIPYAVEARLLGGLLSLAMDGVVVEETDVRTGRFTVQASGRGAGIETLLESSGSLHEGRWVPATTVLHVLVLGRLYRSELQHDATTGFVRYRSRGESFLLRRPRQADDTLTLDGGVHIDDLGSAYLNYAERRWAADADGCFRTLLVRRSASPRPGPDGLAAYRAELRPLVIEPPSALASGRAAARIEITGFSSWALPEQPALVVFGADGRPERIEFRLRYATSVRIRFGVPASGLASGATGFVTRSRGRPRADRSAPAIPGRGLSRRA